MPPEITSASNPRMRHLVRLGKRRTRDRQGVFVVEGPRLVGRAKAAGLILEEAFGDGTVDLPGIEMVTVEPGVLDRVSYRKRSEGVIAVFRQELERSLGELEPTGPSLLLVVENLEKPGNLGAVLRTAEAVGADGVITVPAPVDRYNPNVIRASTGACFTVPIAAADVDQLAGFARALGIEIMAADPSGPVAYWEADLTGPLALVVGAEDSGLSAQMRATADTLVSVPMTGTIDSLNASVTMGLLSYEAVRQRTIA